jgi:hypothetical protein
MESLERDPTPSYDDDDYGMLATLYGPISGWYDGGERESQSDADSGGEDGPPPPADEIKGKPTVGIAFDKMVVRPDNMKMIPSIYPTLSRFLWDYLEKLDDS